MDKLLIGLGGAVLVAAFIFISPIIGVLFGAFAGWIVSMLAPVWVPTGLSYIGINVSPGNLVELGAALGFVGGFFKSSLRTEKK